MLQYVSHFFSAYPLACAINTVLIGSGCRAVEVDTKEGRSVSLCVVEKYSSHRESMWENQSLVFIGPSLTTDAERRKPAAAEH